MGSRLTGLEIGLAILPRLKALLLLQTSSVLSCSSLGEKAKAGLSA